MEWMQKQYERRHTCQQWCGNFLLLYWHEGIRVSGRRLEAEWDHLLYTLNGRRHTPLEMTALYLSESCWACGVIHSRTDVMCSDLGGRAVGAPFMTFLNKTSWSECSSRRWFWMSKSVLRGTKPWYLYTITFKLCPNVTGSTLKVENVTAINKWNVIYLCQSLCWGESSKTTCQRVLKHVTTPL